jgi:hypothetical protein
MVYMQFMPIYMHPPPNEVRAAIAWWQGEGGARWGFDV